MQGDDLIIEKFRIGFAISQGWSVTTFFWMAHLIVNRFICKDNDIRKHI